MLLDEVLLRQSKRKNARKGWKEMVRPDIRVERELLYRVPRC